MAMQYFSGSPSPAICQMINNHAAGQHSGYVCPECGGGPTHERSFAFFIGTDGAVRYICHRASCGAHGAYFTGMPQHAAPIGEAPTLRPYSGPLHTLSNASTEFFRDRYHIVPHWQVISEGEGRYLLPIFGPGGVKARGYNSRRPYPGSPLDTPDTDQGLPKSLTYAHSLGPMQSWYAQGWGAKQGHVILVEDQLSAMRIMSYLHEYDRDAELAVCALLGTGVNQERIAEIQNVVSRYGIVEFALDSDATGQAFVHARKWGQAFHSCRVRILSKDFKDMTDDEVARYFD